MGAGAGAGAAHAALAPEWRQTKAMQTAGRPSVRKLRVLQRDLDALPCMERCTHAVLVLHARASERSP